MLIVVYFVSVNSDWAAKHQFCRSADRLAVMQILDSASVCAERKRNIELSYLLINHPFQSQADIPHEVTMAENASQTPDVDMTLEDFERIVVVSNDREEGHRSPL
ncbi:MAG: hypothetical protein IPP47_22050 [Bryobacterales bacterium]|nr:hypothetical protein [Bryobacterales bacterium]